MTMHPSFRIEFRFVCLSLMVVASMSGMAAQKLNFKEEALSTFDKRDIGKTADQILAIADAIDSVVTTYAMTPADLAPTLSTRQRSSDGMPFPVLGPPQSGHSIGEGYRLKASSHILTVPMQLQESTPDKVVFDIATYDFNTCLWLMQGILPQTLQSHVRVQLRDWHNPPISMVSAVKACAPDPDTLRETPIRLEVYRKMTQRE